MPRVLTSFDADRPSSLIARSFARFSSVFEVTIEEQEEDMDEIDHDEGGMKPMEPDDGVVMDNYLERARKWAFGYRFGWRFAIYVSRSLALLLTTAKPCSPQ